MNAKVIKARLSLGAPAEWGQGGFLPLPLGHHPCRCCSGVTQPIVIPLLLGSCSVQGLLFDFQDQPRLSWETVGGCSTHGELPLLRAQSAVC